MTEKQMTSARELIEHAAEIRRLGKRVVEDVIEVGRRLIECKKLAGHGKWLPWLEREFGWSDKTAENFTNIYKLAQQAKFEKFSDLNLPVGGLYLLAKPSTPDEARAEVIDRAKAGEKVSVAEVKTAVKAKRGKGTRPTADSQPPHTGPVPVLGIDTAIDALAARIKARDGVSEGTTEPPAAEVTEPKPSGAPPDPPARSPANKLH